MNDWDSSGYKHKSALSPLGKKRGCLSNYHFVREKTNQKDSERNEVNMSSTLLRF